MYLLTVTVPGSRHAAKVVAPEVDQHHVFGALLRVALELLGEDGVFALIGPARSGAGDGVGRQLVPLDLEEQLRGRADDLERGRPHEEQVRAGIDPAERPVQADAIDGRPGRWIDGHRERLATREHDLDGLACGDRVLGHLDGVDVLLTAEADVRRAGQGCGPFGGSCHAPT
jgi:hypothetical protein